VTGRTRQCGGGREQETGNGEQGQATARLGTRDRATANLAARLAWRVRPPAGTYPARTCRGPQSAGTPVQPECRSTCSARRAETSQPWATPRVASPAPRLVPALQARTCPPPEAPSPRALPGAVTSRPFRPCSVFPPAASVARPPTVRSIRDSQSAIPRPSVQSSIRIPQSAAGPPNRACIRRDRGLCCHHEADMRLESAICNALGLRIRNPQSAMPSGVQGARQLLMRNPPDFSSGSRSRMPWAWASSRSSPKERKP